MLENLPPSLVHLAFLGIVLLDTLSVILKGVGASTDYIPTYLHTANMYVHEIWFKRTEDVPAEVYNHVYN